MDWFLWVIRAVIIVVGIISLFVVWKQKRGYFSSVLIVGIIYLILGVILLIVSFTTDLSLFPGVFFTAVGAIGITIVLVIRNKWEKNR
jgi:hypothetical protein